MKRETPFTVTSFAAGGPPSFVLGSAPLPARFNDVATLSQALFALSANVLPMGAGHLCASYSGAKLQILYSLSEAEREFLPYYCIVIYDCDMDTKTALMRLNPEHAEKLPTYVAERLLSAAELFLTNVGWTTVTDTVATKTARKE